MEKIGEGEAAERPMDMEANTSVEEVNLEGLHLDTDIVSRERLISLNGSKKRKPEDSLDEQDANIINETHECEEILKKRKRMDPKTIEDPRTRKESTDDLDLMCKIWVMELRRLPLDQQLFARKAVCDVLFEARLGQLNKDSVRINRSDVVQNYLACVKEEVEKICACPNAVEKLTSSSSTPSSKLYPGHSRCYSKGTWKGNLSSPHRPPFFATFSNRFVAPNTMHYPRGPRVGRPLVITTAMSNITTTTIVVVTPRMTCTTVPSSRASNQVVTTTAPGPSRTNTVNVAPYRVENSTNTTINITCSVQTDPVTLVPIASIMNTTLNRVPNTASRSANGTSAPGTSSSSSSNNNNLAASDVEHTVRNHQSTKPTVNTSTTPTINTLCDVRMDTVTTDN